MVLSFFRDLIEVKTSGSTDSYVFRLPQSFWTAKDEQYSIVYELFRFIQDSENKIFIRAKNILSSGLSPNIDSFTLFTLSKEDLSLDLQALADRVYERNYDVLSHKLTNGITTGNYLYIDFDINNLGVLHQSPKFRIGGNANLFVSDYLSSGLGNFFFYPKYALNPSETVEILSFILDRVVGYLKTKRIDELRIEKLILSGVCPFLLDFETVKREVYKKYNLLEKNIVLDISYDFLINELPDTV